MTPQQSKQELQRLHDTFIQSVRQDIAAGRYPKEPSKYREFYLEQLRASDPALHEHLRNIQYRKGDARLLGDVDHIVPQSIWTTLTGLALPHANVLSNLWIRDSHTNRAYDQHMIGLIRQEERKGLLTTEKKTGWVGLFIALKERAIEGHPWVPKSFSRLSRWEVEQLVADLEGKARRGL